MLSKASEASNVNRKRKHVASVGAESAAYPKKRVSVACQVCRARRTKCGTQRPCAFCVKTGAVCVEEPSETTTTEDTSGIFQRLDEIQSQVLDISTAIRALGNRSPPSQAVTNDVACKSVTVDNERMLSAITLDDLLSWKPLAVFNPPKPNLETDTSASQLLTINQSLSKGFLDDLDSSTCRDCVDSFFQRVHVKNPVLDRAETYSWYRSACINGVGWDAESCLVLLVIANGALATISFPSPGGRDRLDLDLAAAFFSAAQKRVGALLLADPVLQARCLFLCGVYLMSILRPFEAWRVFLQALAASQALNQLVSIQRDASETAAQESIYWSCWKSERELRLELGLPPTFPAIHHPLLYPSLPQGTEGDETRIWCFYLAEISLWRQEISARTEIVQNLHQGYDVDLTRLAQLCMRLADSLNSWQESLPPSLDLDTGNEGSDILQFVLKGRLSYNHELITWPFIRAAFHATEIPVGTQELVSMGLEAHFHRLVNNAPGFRYRHHGTWLMLRSSARSACVLLLAAQLPHTAVLLPDEWSNAVEKVIETLDYWSPRFNNGGALTSFMRLLLTASPV